MPQSSQLDLRAEDDSGALSDSYILPFQGSLIIRMHVGWRIWLGWEIVDSAIRIYLTSIKIAFIAVWGNSAVQVTPVTKYKHFRNVPHMKPPFTPNLDIGNQYTTSDYPVSNIPVDPSLFILKRIPVWSSLAIYPPGTQCDKIRIGHK